MLDLYRGAYTRRNRHCNDSVNSEYKFLKEKYANARQQNAAEVYERMDEARTLRNDFARLIGVTFMGEDA